MSFPHAEYYWVASILVEVNIFLSIATNFFCQTYDSFFQFCANLGDYKLAFLNRIAHDGVIMLNSDSCRSGEIESRALNSTFCTCLEILPT